MVKVNSNLEDLELMRSNIMFILFDLGRLIIDDDRKLKAFHNEIAELTRTVYSKVEENYLNTDYCVDFKSMVKDCFGVTGGNYESDSLKSQIHDLLMFMYCDIESSSYKVVGFTQRAQAVIDNQYNKYFNNE